MDFKTAHSIAAATSFLQEYGADAQLLAGGTDLVMQLNRKQATPKVIVHLKGISELSGVTQSIAPSVGAMTTHRAIGMDDRLLADYRSLVQAARTVGGWQTQSIGTIGGNVCNASPAADLMAPLLIHGAQVEIASSDGTRSVALSDFVLGRRKISLGSTEMVTGFQLEPLADRTADTYLKVGRRKAMEVALVGVAVKLSLEPDLETIASARVAVCAAAPTPFRATEVEQLLVGTAVAGVSPELCAVIDEQASPIDDPRASARYRRRVLPGLVKRAVLICAKQIRSNNEGSQ